MNPRVFIGTLHNNEGDFERCVRSVSGQIDVDVTHEVISDLNEKDAHNELWSRWRSAQSTHDFFVKVDADTVLRTKTTIREICDVITSKGATGLQAPLHDYMTDGFIDGMNAYASSVTFTETKDNLYCDRDICTGNTYIVRGDKLPLSLQPAGKHCHEATELQAFRYAIHRAMKDQRETLQKVIYAWRRHGDRVRGVAVIGVMIAKRFVEVENHKSDYSDPGFVAAYEDVERRYDEYIDAINNNRLEIFS